MPAKRVVAFWLIPASSEKQLFSALIRILAREFKAPEFEPHVTLFTLTVGPIEARRILKALRVGQFSLRVNNVGYSGAFTKTLFVRLGTGVRLKALLKKSSLEAGKNISMPAAPHLSLCYKKLPTSAKRELAAFIKLPVRSVSFDLVKAVHCASSTRNARDVKAWRTIGTVRLRD